MRSWISLVAVMAFAVSGAAQQPEISELAVYSGIIFRGTVMAVVAEAPQSPGEIAVRRVTFRVEDGIRGTTTGETLTIRQWNAAANEYRVGEALVLFLYAPSEDLGLTSPVGGRAGHRRIGDVAPEVLNSLRTAARPSPTAPAPSNSPQRPARATRGGSR